MDAQRIARNRRHTMYVHRYNWLACLPPKLHQHFASRKNKRTHVGLLTCCPQTRCFRIPTTYFIQAQKSNEPRNANKRLSVGIIRHCARQPWGPIWKPGGSPWFPNPYKKPSKSTEKWSVAPGIRRFSQTPIKSLPSQP